MRRTTRSLAAPAAAVIAAVVPALCGCAGRTASNMEPRGETVEVRVAQHDTAPQEAPATNDTIMQQ